MYTANGIGYEGFCPEGQWIRFKVPEELGIVYHTGPSNDDDDMSWDVNVKLVEIYDGDITDCLVLFDNSDQNGCDWDSMTEENQNKLLNYLIDNRSELKVDGSGSLNWTEDNMVNESVNSEFTENKIEDEFKGFIGEDNDIIQNYLEEHGMAKTMIEYEYALLEKTKLVINKFQLGDNILVPLEALYDQGDEYPNMSPIDVALFKKVDNTVINTEKTFSSYEDYKKSAIDTVWHKDEFQIKEFKSIDEFIVWSKSIMSFDHMICELKL